MKLSYKVIVGYLVIANITSIVWLPAYSGSLAFTVIIFPYKLAYKIDVPFSKMLKLYVKHVPVG